MSTIEGFPREAGNEKVSSESLSERMAKMSEKAGERTSSGRTAEEYQRELFPDFEDLNALLDYLDGKTVVDLGSGRTSKNPYSLINAAAREKDRKIRFFGVDLNAAYKQVAGVEKLSKPELKKRLKILMRTEKPLTDITGERKVVAARIDQLPVGAETVDLFLSDYLVSPYFVLNKKKLLQIFQEMLVALRPGGEIRIHPVDEKVRRRWLDPKDELGQFLTESFGIEPASEGKKNKTFILKKNT